MSLRNLSILLWLNIVIISCGYQFYESPVYFKSHWKTIYIAPWKNFTSESGLGEMLAYELRHKFAEGKFLIPVYNEAKADLILKGEVTKVYLEPVAYETFIQTKERKISFEGKYKLINKEKNEIILEGTLNRYEIYRIPTVTVSLIDPGREEALRLLVKDLSEIILQEIMFKDMEIK